MQFSISKALKTSSFHSMQINQKHKMGLNWVCKIDNGNQPNSTLETQAIVQNPQIPLKRTPTTKSRGMEVKKLACKDFSIY